MIFKSLCLLSALAVIVGLRCGDYLKSCSKYRTSCDNKVLRKYCRITCQKCIPEPQTYTNCRDTDIQCGTVFKEGRCRKNKQDYEYSKRKCRATCGFCRNSKPRSKPEFPRPDRCGIAALRPINELQVASISLRADVVIGETSVRKGFFPWQAAVYFSDEYQCGGVLISKKFLLSTAGCFKPVGTNATNITVVLGEYDRGIDEGSEQYINAKKVNVHKNFTLTEEHNDIALIELEDEAKFTNYVSPICLPTVGEEHRSGSICSVTGWSRAYTTGEAAKVLQEITVPIIDPAICNSKHTFEGRTVSSNNMICSGYQDSIPITCLRDSGAPLSCNVGGIWKVFGILMPTCHGLQGYNVFTKVSSYLSWIEEIRSNAIES